jgi:hypothetical protein
MRDDVALFTGFCSGETGLGKTSPQRPFGVQRLMYDRAEEVLLAYDSQHRVQDAPFIGRSLPNELRCSEVQQNSYLSIVKDALCKTAPKI